MPVEGDSFGHTCGFPSSGYLASREWPYGSGSHLAWPDHACSFAWQWHPGAVDPAVDYDKEPWTTVTFTLEPSGRGTRLSVSETGFDAISIARRAKVFADNSGGWTEVIVWIQQHAEAAR